jgi:2-C-methyl-D-erythritol 2,4-cyclodiphosphate synthase
MFRIGFGYDVHQLAEGRTFILGGIPINHHKGPVAHSDGDVLIHAICDAMLGAANLRDIGIHFPDNSNEFKNIDSKILLKRTNELLLNKGYKIVNIDSTICLQAPKIKDLIPQMQSTLAGILEISSDDLSIKATTTERLGYVGSEDGIDAYAVVLIQKTINT